MKLNRINLFLLFIWSIFMGITGVSIGFGTEFTPINTVMAPLVCPGNKIIPVWEYRGPQQLADGPDLRTRWVCVNESTGEVHIAGYRTIFTAGTIYGLLIMGAVIAWTLFQANRQKDEKIIS